MADLGRVAEADLDDEGRVHTVILDLNVRVESDHEGGEAAQILAI